MNDAHQDDVVVLVSCCKAGPRYVRQSSRSTWRCGSCRATGFDLRVVALGLDGALPAPERDAAGASTPADVNTNRAVTSAVAAGL